MTALHNFAAIVLPSLLVAVMAASLFATPASATDEADADNASAALLPALEEYVEARKTEFAQISPERREQLAPLTAFVRSKIDAGQPVSLNFICTHNSRRSHMSQLWAQVAATHFDLPGVRTYSGGTEWTAFNPRAVAAVQRAGFEVKRTTDDANPVYHVQYSPYLPPMTCFSKIYDGAPNPRESLAAVMVCNDADENCPAVLGAEARISLPFVDPKVSDGTPAEAATYDERCAQIARELLYAMSRVME